MTEQEFDPRPLYRDALEWASALVDGVRPEHMPLPTPCTDFDVATLLGHQLAGVRRARTMGDGGDATTVPFVLTYDGDPAAAYREEARSALRSWEDDARLSAMVTAPWGIVPGRAAVWAYVNETLVHAWDLAVSTGQPCETDPAVVLPVVEAAKRAIPGDQREYMPFGEVVAPRPEAGPTERLANWSGRETAPWMSRASS